MVTRKKDASRGLTEEGPASSYTLADFPELVLHQQRCRLCKLVVAAPSLLRDIHALWGRGQGAREIWNELAQPVQQATASTQPYSFHSFMRHLDKHVAKPRAGVFGALAQRALEATVDAKSEAKRGAKRDAPVANVPESSMSLKVMATSLPSLPTAPVAGFAGDQDFTELWEMYNRIKPIVIYLCQAVQDKLRPDAAGETQGVNAYDVVMVSKLFEQARGTLADLNRIKNSDRLIRHMIDDTARGIVTQIGGAIAVPLRALADTLERGDAVTARHLITKMLNEDLVSTIATAARESTARSLEQYHLH